MPCTYVFPGLFVECLCTGIECLQYADEVGTEVIRVIAVFDAYSNVKCDSYMFSTLDGITLMKLASVTHDYY